jgi:hypothetical protein
METNKPRMQITERINGIPVQATCTSCPETTFYAGAKSGDTAEESERTLKDLFDHHFRTVHEEKPSRQVPHSPS